MKRIIAPFLFLFIMACKHADTPEIAVIVEPKYYLSGYYYDSNSYIGSDRGLRSLTITDSTIQGHDYYIKKLPGMSYLVDSTSPIYPFKQESDTIVLINGIRHFLYTYSIVDSNKSCRISIGSIDYKNANYKPIYVDLKGKFNLKSN